MAFQAGPDNRIACPFSPAIKLKEKIDQLPELPLREELHEGKDVLCLAEM
jgi:hypothetical protein